MACATFLYREFCFSSSHDFNDHNFCRMFFLFSMTIANQRYLNGNSWIKKKWAIQDKGKSFRETWSNRQSFGQRQTAEKWYMKTKVDWKHCQATLLLHNGTTKLDQHFPRLQCKRCEVIKILRLLTETVSVSSLQNLYLYIAAFFK